MTSIRSSPKKECVYVSTSFKENFEPLRSGKGAKKEAKVMAKQMLKREGCDLSGEQPPLKCRKASNTYIVECCPPAGVKSPVSRLLESTKGSRPASAQSTGTNVMPASHDSTAQPSLLDLVQALQREQAAANERAIRTERKLDRTEKKHEATQAELAQVKVAASEAQRKLDRTEKKLEATQAELAQVKVAASEAQSFSRQSALCQMRALYEKYRFFYYSKTVDAYRGGSPASFEDADNRWKEYMAGASPEERRAMEAKGFTAQANYMAKKGPGSFHSRYSDEIHMLNRSLIPECVKLLGQQRHTGVAKVIATVDACTASSL